MTDQCKKLNAGMETKKQSQNAKRNLCDEFVETA